MKSTAGWFVMLLAGLLLIVIGFEGALGKIIGVAFCPGNLRYYSDVGSLTSASTANAIAVNPATALATSNAFTI
jgi:hypothetical protein